MSDPNTKHKSEKEGGESNETVESKNFIEVLIEEHIASGKNGGKVHTRFPPEPNGYLHIGHAWAVCTNFMIAQKYGGQTNLRFDDTNPAAEESEYVDAIRSDIKWLGFDWGENEFFTSDYFDQLYDWAVKLVKAGKAYVDDSTAEDMRTMRGIPSKPGTESPFRKRSEEENLNLLARMKAGEFDEGSRILRAKIDMTSPNMHLRDPAMYRIINAPHHRTGEDWHIYPMYDWAHGQSDSMEGITHSLCSLEFEVHRPLYDWFTENLEIFAPQQIEFARLNLSYTITSKRKLRQLVEGAHVNGWDDPRMPTIRGLRRAGYTPESIKSFSKRVGLSKRNRVIDVSSLEFSVREDLNKTAPRIMAVLNPVKLKIENYEAGKTEEFQIENNPEDPSGATRTVPFSSEVWIEREDFMEEPPRKFFRLGPGKMVRLKGAYIVECTGFDKDENGEITEIRCNYFPDSRSGEDNSGLKVKGTIHWVSAAHALTAEVRLYDRLFMDEAPDSNKEKDFLELLNPNSLEVLDTVYVEPAIKDAKPGRQFQFLRKGYFCVDPDSENENKLIFNRTVTLRDGWKKK
ncbi:MAG: glutaminyl-tRNA synthetase [Limisphaerales bacterium]|jgi:glutaminyl-tRNA synthetase